MFFLLRLIIGKAGIAWFAKSMTDNKGEASARRLSAFWLMALYGAGHISYIVIMHNASDQIKLEMSEYLIWLMIIDIVGALVFIGLVTIQNIQMFAETMKGEKLFKSKTEKTKETTETTTETTP